MRESLQKIEGKLSARLVMVYAVAGALVVMLVLCVVSWLPSVAGQGRAGTLRLLRSLRENSGVR